ncbi:unnamed protein product [Acanthoscelides obtectus]|uniref:DUF4371 domain-containing protein n=1 Tax=Acanthoscelides obtectus TaxID=200917 RepID=A0A9P0Q709_ACAOB|nr:unnamed protein product [Acanthoscelides obtectus]CAK1629888.1 Protein ZBED8 [Acanthoscelides obtectus]
MIILPNPKVEEETYTGQNVRSLLIAKSGKPHNIGEKLILSAVEEVLKTVLHKPASDIIKRIPLSNNTVERRIDEMSSDIESFLCNYLQTTHFSIQLDESTLPDNAALLLAYVRFIMNQEIYEELLFARTLITDIKDESIFHVLKDYFIEKAIPLSNIISVATDGAPVMGADKLAGQISRGIPIDDMQLCAMAVSTNLNFLVNGSDHHGSDSLFVCKSFITLKI